jgi:hypothetical protein
MSLYKNDLKDLNTMKAPEKVEKMFRVGGKEGREKEITLLRDFVYSHTVENQLYLVTKREIALYDMGIKQVKFVG